MPKPADGQLVRVAGTKAVYLVMLGQSCWVPSPKCFEQLFTGWNLVHEISQADFDSIPSGAEISPDAYLAMPTEGPEPRPIFLVSWGLKNVIGNPAVFAKYGFNKDKVRREPLPPALGKGWSIW